jgi:hypothetical protein
MKAIKVILGSFCLLFASLLFLLFVVAGLKFRSDWLVALAGCGFAGIGFLLMVRRNLPISRRGRIGILLSVGSIAISLLIGVPWFIQGHAVSCGNACVNNLRQIDGAKNEWAVETGKTNGTIATETDIKPYIKLDAAGNIPKCPDGGIYTIGRVGENPTCSLGTNIVPPHVLP